MEEISSNPDYIRSGRPIRRYQVPFYSRSRSKILILVGIGIIILIVLIAIFFRGGNNPSTEAYTALLARVNTLEKNLTRLEEIENRVVLLEKQDKRLRQSVVETKQSGKSLTRQLDKLTQNMTNLEKRMSSVTAKAPAPGAVQKMPLSQAKGRYHEVSRGDTLYKIAKIYGISLSELRRLNNFTRDQAIYPGQKVLVAPASPE